MWKHSTGGKITATSNHRRGLFFDYTFHVKALSLLSAHAHHHLNATRTLQR
jgi:hypothetical protein